MNIHTYVLDQLELTKGTWPEVADGSGVPLRTVEKIARQEILNPGVHNIQILFDYFQARGKRDAKNGRK